MNPLWRSIDPGKHGVGLASWSGSTLLEARYVPTEVRLSDVDLVVCEVPQIYPMEKWKGDPNDLIDVAVVAGMHLAKGLRQVMVRPREWKGSVPKTIHNNRVLTQLDPLKKAMVDVIPKTLRHNVVDAIGLGLWYLNTRKGGT